MKFYETTADEYIASKDRYNLHPELKDDYFPKSLKTFDNLIVYGPSGSGKYTQVLSIIQKFSPSELKYEKKITVQSDKQSYIFKMSDIHYEIDMSFLGCNSKTLWHDIFFQIVDIVSIKTEKIGIIICKQFHMIHSELLEIFYSYMQRLPQVSIKFILITEHISFFPNNILNMSAILSIKRPLNMQIIQISNENKKEETFIKRISSSSQKQFSSQKQLSSSSQKQLSSSSQKQLSSSSQKQLSSSSQKHLISTDKEHLISSDKEHLISSDKEHLISGDKEHLISGDKEHLISGDKEHLISGETQISLLENLDTNLLLNIKEILSFDLIKTDKDIPKDIFNTICDQIIGDIENIDKIPFTEFRDSLYDIMIYNLDVVECVWYILIHFIQINKISGDKCSMVLKKIYPFLQYFNNNYRPIYHLENIMFYIINVIKYE